MQNGSIQSNGEAMTKRAAVDPLLNLVRAYRSEHAAFMADKDADGLYLGWLLDRLVEDTPPCWSPEGASEALRLVADNIIKNDADMHRSVLASVTAFSVARADEVAAAAPEDAEY